MRRMLSQSFPHLPMINKKRERGYKLVLKQEKLQLDTRRNFLLSGCTGSAVIRFSAGSQQNGGLSQKRAWNRDPGAE